MGFAEYLNHIDWNAERLSLYSQSPADVERALAGVGEPLARFKALLSPAAGEYLERLAQRSRALTLQRFGRVQQLFAPLYLSNACANECLYCGFSMSNPIRRKVLKPDEIRIEADALRARGFQHLLLVAGEAPKVAGVDYYHHALQALQPDFSQLSLEVQPLATEDYHRLREVGLHAVLVYQETYDAACYQQLHTRGQKQDFAYRLDALDRAGKAGVHKLGLGVLLGLTDWRLDTLKCAHHLLWLSRRHWRSRFSLSFPRLRPAEGGFKAPAPVSDRQLVQLLCAWRLLAPDLELTLSTRESPALRDRLIALGVTSLSAASSTRPGGYAVEPGTALEQFSTDDQRPVAEVVQSLRNQHYQPVWSDWHRRLG
ncbi:2-iminoacetate synthase ThiH [Saccharospirillum sp. HFRX-1]|uniref:2-iminoacetate synthase ThiH n=1 Tax=unclassified Saccharospirillum TaxID=2633430 RepID=UPI0037203666